jgi:hypothetical protein
MMKSIKHLCVTNKTFGVRNMSTQKVGIIGLGKMGVGVARNLAGTGKYSLVLHDINPKITKELAAELKGVAVGSPAEMAKQVDNIISIVPNDACLKDVVLGDNGIIAGSKGRTSPLLHVSCSTVSPFTSRELCKISTGKSRHFSLQCFGFNLYFYSFPISISILFYLFILCLFNLILT